MDQGDIYGIQFVKPTDKKSKFVSKSTDYTVIMHFSNYIRQKIMERGVTAEGIEQAFQDFQFNSFKQKNSIQNINFPSAIEDADARMTLNQ